MVGRKGALDTPGLNVRTDGNLCVAETEQMDVIPRRLWEGVGKGAHSLTLPSAPLRRLLRTPQS